ncbi:MAG TPA: hypothetical protein VMV29_14675 [Ktedonobacterales bacterium]|nr:hypothetical protein [Ktedonobacterales bacterium]
MRKLLIAPALALALWLGLSAPTAFAGTVPHVVPPGCPAVSSTTTPCYFNVPGPGNPEITVGPTTSGSGEVGIPADQASFETYRFQFDIMKEAKPGASKAWVGFRHHDSKNKYVLLEKNRNTLQFIVEKSGTNYTLFSAPYVVALNQNVDVEIDAEGTVFTLYDRRGGGRVRLAIITDNRIAAGDGDTFALYTNQGSQACWSIVSGQPPLV